MQSSPVSRHFLRLRSKYSPQHPVLKCCERPSFTPTQNNSFETFTSVTFQMEVFWVMTPCNVVVGYQLFRGPCRYIYIYIFPRVCKFALYLHMLLLI
jgi:hypothetical protein